MMMDERYWLWQAENTFCWAEESRDWKWEQYGYFYLFKAYGYDGGV
jgi:hypothetical protein